MTRIRSHTTAKIRVESTNEIIEVHDSLLDWEPVPVEEVGGGAGREYWAEYEFDDVIVTWTVFESPPGVLNTVKHQAEGGEVVEDFAFFLDPIHPGSLRQFPVELPSGKFVNIDLDGDLLDLISTEPSFPAAIENALTLRCRVPDVWRYIVRIKNGEIMMPLEPVTCPSVPSNYPDRLAEDAVGSAVILLILESPHKDEYKKDNDGRLVPRAPAQNRGLFGAGRGIKVYGHHVFSKLGLPDGEYSLVIANPVPYQCSLSSVASGKPVALKPEVRDHVWLRLFALKSIRQNFLDRCSRYRPRVVLNCCTKTLRATVTDLIANHFLSGDDVGITLFESEHPAVQWCTMHKKGLFCSTRGFPSTDGGPGGEMPDVMS